MLLRQLRDARIRHTARMGKSPPASPEPTQCASIPADQEQDSKLTRLSIGPSLVVPPAAIKISLKRRCSKTSVARQPLEHATPRKRRKDVDLSLARVVPVDKLPLSILRDLLVSSSCPWDEPPPAPRTDSCQSFKLDCRCSASWPFAPSSPENEWEFGNPSFSPPLSKEHPSPKGNENPPPKSRKQDCCDNSPKTPPNTSTSYKMLSTHLDQFVARQERTPSIENMTGCDFDLEMLRALRIGRKRGTTYLG